MSKTMTISISSKRNATTVLTDQFWMRLNSFLIEEEEATIEQMFKETTANWDEQPEFTKKSSSHSGTPGYAWGEISSTSKPFVWVVLGTKKRYMRMAPGYNPKSSPNKLGVSGTGGPRRGLDIGSKGSGPRARGRRIKPRNFHKLIARERNRLGNKDSFQRRVRDTYVIALRSGLQGAVKLPMKSNIVRGRGNVTWP